MKKKKNGKLQLLLAALLVTSTEAFAQFGGFGGFGGGMPDMSSMFPQVKHTKVEGLKSNLPVVYITTETALNAQKKVTAHMKCEGYDGPISIKLRGNSSLSFNQKKYTLETRDENGKEVNVALLGMPAHSKWVLLAPYNDVSMLRDPLAFQLWREMGHWGPRTTMVELVMDGEYHGIYIFCEAIKRGAERVNVSKLKKKDIEGRDLTGGYILRIDTYNEDDATFQSKVPGIGDGIMTSQITWSCIYPKKKNLQPEQFAYIQNFVDSMELAIQGEDFMDPVKGYAHYIDVESFVDYFIHSELSLNADGYKRSAYFYKEKLHEDGTGGKIHAGPVWDYNLAYGNCNFCNANNLEAWCFEGGNTNPRRRGASRAATPTPPQPSGNDCCRILPSGKPSRPAIRNCARESSARNTSMNILTITPNSWHRLRTVTSRSIQSCSSVLRRQRPRKRPLTRRKVLIYSAEVASEEDLEASAAWEASAVAKAVSTPSGCLPTTA